MLKLFLVKIIILTNEFKIYMIQQNLFNIILCGEDNQREVKIKNYVLRSFFVALKNEVVACCC